MLGHVTDILTTGGEEVGLVSVEAGRVFFGVASGFPKGRFKRVRFTEKTLRPFALQGFGDVIMPIFAQGSSGNPSFPGRGRRVARAMREGSSPRGGLDKGEDWHIRVG